MVASYGDIPLFMPSILILSRTYAAVLNAYTQYFFVILLSFSMHGPFRLMNRSGSQRSVTLGTLSACYTVLNFFIFLCGTSEHRVSRLEVHPMYYLKCVYTAQVLGVLKIDKGMTVRFEVYTDTDC